MEYGKRRTNAHISGESAVNILKGLFPSSWVVREYVPDYGIDLNIELFSSFEDGYITKGEHIFFQVKGTGNFTKTMLKVKPRENVEKAYKEIEGDVAALEVIKYVLDTSLLATIEAMGAAVPALLAVVDISQKDAYFVCLNDYIEKIIVPENPDYMSQHSVTIYIPTSNKINDRGIKVIEWYAKRAKLYALFNKINYQKRELRYCSLEELEGQTQHFLKILLRSDVWSAANYFGAMRIAKKEVDYYLEHGITCESSRVIEAYENMGEDVDSEIWENPFCADLVSFRTAQKIEGLYRLWDKMALMCDVFEDMTKEAFLPTQLGTII